MGIYGSLFHHHSLPLYYNLFLFIFAHYLGFSFSWVLLSTVIALFISILWPFHYYMLAHILFSFCSSCQVSKFSALWLRFYNCRSNNNDPVPSRHCAAISCTAVPVVAVCSAVCTCSRVQLAVVRGLWWSGLYQLARVLLIDHTCARFRWRPCPGLWRICGERCGSERARVQTKANGNKLKFDKWGEGGS